MENILNPLKKAIKILQADIACGNNVMDFDDTPYTLVTALVKELKGNEEYEQVYDLLFEAEGVYYVFHADLGNFHYEMDFDEEREKFKDCLNLLKEAYECASTVK